MAPFARLIGGEWRMSAGAWPGMRDTWHWGPGRNSVHALTDGLDATGNPWRALQVFYWHPGQKQVCVLNIHPDIPGIGRGVGEGTIAFDGVTANGVFDLYQPGNHRKMGLRWTFVGPDKYHDVLLEATGPEGLKPLAEWDHFHSNEAADSQPSLAGTAPQLPKHLKSLQPLLGRIWETSFDSEGDGTGVALNVQTTLEWVPIVDYVHARVRASEKDSEPTHLWDIYLYFHVKSGSLRCLALSNRGGVYEGDLSVLDGGALQVELNGNEGDEIVLQIARFDLENDGNLRHRAWSIEGTKRTLVLDVQHTNREPNDD
jgi:hypothetical protein